MTKRPLAWSLTRAATDVLPAKITDVFDSETWAFGYRPDQRRDAPAFTRIAGATVPLASPASVALTWSGTTKTVTIQPQTGRVAIQ